MKEVRSKKKERETNDPSKNPNPSPIVMRGWEVIEELTHLEQ